MTGDTERNFLNAFDEHWDDYRKQFKAARSGISEESIHDLRVAARRLQALLSIIRALATHPRVKKLRRFVKKQLNQLDELHDTQVMVQEADQSMASLPQLVPFREYLQTRSDDLASTARKALRKSKPSDLEKRVKKIRQVAKKHSDDQTLVEHLLRVVDDAYAEIIERFGNLSLEDPTTIHRVRIAFKKFRYMVETIQPFLPDYPPDYPDKMHGYQDAMGKVRDTTVFLSTLKEFEQRLEQHGKGQAPAFESKPIELYYQKRLNDLIQAYFQRKDELNSFWRTAPDRPFPWEKKHDSVHRTTRNRRTTGSQQQRAGGQPETSHRRRAQKVPEDREGTGGSGNSDRPDHNQSVPTGS